METQLQDYENRKFMIFAVTELPQIDFTQVCETSSETLRLSLDKSLVFVKWDSIGIPSSVESLTTKEGPFSYEEILNILSGPEWTDPNPII